ncbi:MAG TPA: MFS transporter [Chloroflexia bacterium]|nr:MFS transporter [Chloroflexia bacterium]
MKSSDSGQKIVNSESTEVNTEKSTEKPTELDQKLVWIFAVACGLSVANLYYIQPVLADMGRSLNIAANQIGLVATLGQLGYAIGLLLIVPLGDVTDRRGLIFKSLLGVALALIGVAVAPGFLWLAVANLIVGITTVVPQIIVPFAATLARPHERGRVVGTVMSGLLIGILLSRTASGFINSVFGWRTMYWLAAGMMLVLALVLRSVLPDTKPHASLRYPELMRSLWHLARTEPVLRQASVFGALAFGAFNVFWVTLAFFLETPPYHFSSGVVGLFGLVGVAGALGASYAGKLADRLEPRKITGISLLIALASFLIIWLLGYALWGLIVGVILLDLGAQMAHISNQTRVYSLNPQARSRLNTVYMVSYFIGGSLGSALGVYGWQLAGWNGVGIAGVTMLGLALIIFQLTAGAHKVEQLKARHAER